MDKITVYLKYSEICAIKHALDLRIEKKKRFVMRKGYQANKKFIKEIFEEENLSDIFEQIIEENKENYEVI